MRLFANANYKFIPNRKRAYMFSAFLMLFGIIGMVLNIITTGSWLDYGVDFTGGVVIEVRFNTPAGIAQVRQALGDVSVTQYGNENEFVIRSQLSDQEVQVVRADIEGRLGQAFSAGSFEVVRTELVGPTVGQELQRTAVVAMLLSFLLTLIYLAFRFEFRFGLAAIIATFHDIIITLGFIALFRIEVNLQIVAAILTIVGYSLNDTIVVFDRIRENLHKKGARKQDQIDLIDRSINETLPRTVMTGVSVLATLVALILFGPPTLRGFSVVLFLGIIIGTYSSFFIGSPALVEIRKRFGEGGEREKKPRPQPATV